MPVSTHLTFSGNIINTVIRMYSIRYVIMRKGQKSNLPWFDNGIKLVYKLLYAKQFQTVQNARLANTE